MEKLKSPSRTEKDPILKFKQKGFGAGMYMDLDLPASEIPNSGVRWAQNILLYQDYAEVRPGTELHTDLIPPFIEGRDDYVATKSGYIITKTAGTNFSAEDVDSYFWWPDSERRDLIVEYINANQVRVKHADAEGPTTTANPGAIMPPENAKKLFHNSSKKLFAFFGTDVYWTDWRMTAWTRLPLRSSQDAADIPVSAESVFDQNQSTVYLINPLGLFAIDTRQDPMELFKVNTICPDNEIAEVPEGGLNVFGRRYLHSMSRLTGIITENRMDGVRIQNESGTNNIDHETESQDYREVYGVDPDTGNRLIGPIVYPQYWRHWTHVPIYATKDLVQETTDPEYYILLDEVPVAKAFDAFRSNLDGHIHISVGGNGTFAIEDVGNTIVFSDGTVDIITDWISDTEVVGTGVLAAVAGQGAGFGVWSHLAGALTGRVMTASQTGDIITRVAGTGIFGINDVGRTVFWADRYTSFIVEYIDADHVRAITSAAHVQQGLVIDPVDRYYNDRINDDTLTNRESQWQLYQRFHLPLPSLETGIVLPGYIAVSRAGVDEIHYSQLSTNREYLGGYYNPYYQMMPIKDSITALREFKDRMVIYCANSTFWVATNVSLAAEVPSIGEYVSVLPGVNSLDLRVGVKDKGSIHRLPDGREIVVTSEPGLRICNGSSFSENFAVDANGRSFVLSELQKAQQRTAVGYDPNKLGYLLFFSDQAPDN
jgi:hypothetical protein